ncbi:MAG: hypothetical protein LLF89_08535 [Spirochaetaceae bacterium]|nr:hypothetical protein [Spirochaetaceae bacterium]
MNTTTLKRKFSIERTAILIRNRAFEDLPGILIGAGLLLGINLLSIVAAKRAVFNDGSGQAWTFFLLGAGILFSSYAFKGMHDGKSGLDWILLPATPLEKYLAALIEYIILYPLVGAALTLGLSALLSLFESMAGGRGGRIWMPGFSDALRAWGEYAVVALWFLAGSATFRRKSFLKSAGVLMAYMLVMMIGFFLVLASRRSSANGVVLNEMFYMNGRNGFIGGSFPEAVQSALGTVVDVLRYAVLPVFSLGYGYLRVVEKEVRDEVQ